VPLVPARRGVRPGPGGPGRILLEVSPDELERVERDVVHDTDAGGALSALSASASLLVVGASSDPSPRGLLGQTTRALLARTRCPLAVVPTAPPGFPGGMRRPARSRGTFAPDRSRRPGPV